MWILPQGSKKEVNPGSKYRAAGNDLEEKLASRVQSEEELRSLFFKGYNLRKSRKSGRTGFQKQILSREQTGLVS